MRFLVFLLLLFSTHAYAFSELPASNAMKEHIPDAKTVGEARLVKLVWKVYDATLVAPSGTWNGKGPFALDLAYLRAISGQDIVEETVKQWKQLGYKDEKQLAAWQAAITRIFPDVEKGTHLTGLQTTEGYTKFYKDERFIGEVEDPDFSTAFFAIWLSEGTSEKGLRKKLLGLR